MTLPGDLARSPWILPRGMNIVLVPEAKRASVDDGEPTRFISSGSDLVR